MNKMLIIFLLASLSLCLRAMEKESISGNTLQKLILQQDEDNIHFCWALGHGNYQQAQELKNRANPNCKMVQDLLLKLIKQGNAQSILPIRELLKSGTNPNFIKNEYPYPTPLIAAIECPNRHKTFIIQELLDAGASIYLANQGQDQTPLYIALIKNDCPTMEILLTHNPKAIVHTLEMIDRTESFDKGSDIKRDYTSMKILLGKMLQQTSPYFCQNAQPQPTIKSLRLSE